MNWSSYKPSFINVTNLIKNTVWGTTVVRTTSGPTRTTSWPDHSDTGPQLYPTHADMVDPRELTWRCPLGISEASTWKCISLEPQIIYGVFSLSERYSFQVISSSSAPPIVFVDFIYGQARVQGGTTGPNFQGPGFRGARIFLTIASARRAINFDRKKPFI